MLNVKSALEDSLEKVEKGATSQVKTVAQAAKGQITGNTATHTSSDQGTSESGHVDPAQQAHSAQATKDLVKELYAPSADHASGGDSKSNEFITKQIEEGKTPEEAVQMQNVRKKLHDEGYYIPLTQRKSHDQEVQEEEQKEEQEKMEALQEEDKKKADERPIAVQQAADRTERFPGAAG